MKMAKPLSMGKKEVSRSQRKAKGTIEPGIHFLTNIFLMSINCMLLIFQLISSVSSVEYEDEETLSGADATAGSCDNQTEYNEDTGK
jgi:hypothetical protein